MIALPELHNLIRSLNKPEKRFFKLLSATEKMPVDKAIALFDFIEKINDKDDLYYRTERETRIDISMENLNLLYNLILNSQRNFYSETITSFSINDELSNLKILFEKAQYKQCRKMIKPVKEKALESEKFNYLLEILELEKQLLSIEVLGEEYSIQYKKLQEQQQNFIDHEKNVGTYYQLYARLRFQIKSNSLKGKKNQDAFFEAFLEDPKIKNPKNALSKKSMFLLMKCRALCYNALRHQEQRCKQLVDLKAFMQKDQLIFDEMPRQYMDVLYSLANTYIEQSEFSQAKKILSEIQGLINSRKIIGIDLVIKLQSYSYNAELLLLMSTGKFKEAADLAQTIYEFVLNNDTVFNKEDKSVLLYNLTNFYIYNNNYTTAQGLVDIVRTTTDKNARWDLKYYSRIQEMVICYELKEYSKLSLINNSIKALMKEKVFTTATETTFISFFNEIADNPTLNVPEKRYSVLYKELKNYLNTEEDRWVNFFYFNFLAYAGYKAGEGHTKDLIIKNFVVDETV
ncbi:MAG: hypothetical protein K0S32_3920 [Bacteroidetes bacterium]|jgi:hypothetical protein|nr:hypothetical protein [Bacteroidota bacterium]